MVPTERKPFGDISDVLKIPMCTIKTKERNIMDGNTGNKSGPKRSIMFVDSDLRKKNNYKIKHG